MDLIKEVENIERPGIRDLEWYYHTFYYTDDHFRDFITEGIKCRELLNLGRGGNNGRHYISLLKDLGVKEEMYGFDSFMESFSSFILTGIHTVRCSTVMWPLYNLFANTKIPLRASGWKDEYQAYLKIEPSKFVGVQCPLYNWLIETLTHPCIGDNTRELVSLKKMILLLKEYNINIPIYDYSRKNGEHVHIIDQEMYLDKCEEMAEEVEERTKSLKWG